LGEVEVLALVFARWPARFGGDVEVDGVQGGRVICSVPSRTAWMAARGLSRSRLPIMPVVRR